MGRMPDGMVNSRKENKIMLEKVKEIVAESLNVEESTLSETTSFKEDLGADHNSGGRCKIYRITQVEV